jgi:hypothetical protein
VRSTCALIENEISPLFVKLSCIPTVEADRRNTAMALDLIESTVLRDLGEFPADFEDGEMERLRKLLCVSIGKLHSFLQDALARTLASDPRSRFDADYFLSRRFPSDVEEAEWLLASVEDLERRLAGIQEERKVLLPELSKRIGASTAPMDSQSWDRVVDFLDRLESDLVSDVREVSSLRGIRFDEMEALERHARELPLLAHLLREVGRHNRDILDALTGAEAPRPDVRSGGTSTTNAAVQKTANRRLSELMNSLDERLRDLEAFVPFWLQEICRRRALMLRAPHRRPPEGEDAESEAGSLGEAEER